MFAVEIILVHRERVAPVSGTVPGLGPESPESSGRRGRLQTLGSFFSVRKGWFCC